MGCAEVRSPFVGAPQKSARFMSSVPAQGAGAAAAVPEQQPTVRVMRLFKPGLHVMHANPQFASLPEIDVNRGDFAISQVRPISISLFSNYSSYLLLCLYISDGTKLYISFYNHE